MPDIKSLARDVVAAPLGEVIASVGQGVADAQFALDEGSLGAVLDVYAESDDERLKLLREIGYRPTFYALPETTGEVRVTLRLGQGAAGQGTGRALRTTPSPGVRAVPLRAGLNARMSKLYATPVDAGYQNQFGFNATVSAKLSFKIVPIPAPDGADELRMVPDLDRRSVPAARQALEALGLIASFVDAEGTAQPDVSEEQAVAGQDPEAGTILRLGDTVEVMVAVEG